MLGFITLVTHFNICLFVPSSNQFAPKILDLGATLLLRKKLISKPAHGQLALYCHVVLGLRPRSDASALNRACSQTTRKGLDYREMGGKFGVGASTACEKVNTSSTGENMFRLVLVLPLELVPKFEWGLSVSSCFDLISCQV